MATLLEHFGVIAAAIKAAEIDGFDVVAETCCCGAGLVIRGDGTELDFDVYTD